jgi:hypothetical protein
MLGGQKESGMQATPLAKKERGCANTNATKEGPNERHSKDLTPKSKPKTLGGEGAKEEQKNLEGDPNKSYNVFEEKNKR